MKQFLWSVPFALVLIAGSVANVRADEPTLLKKEGKAILREWVLMETTPVVWQGKPLLLCCERPTGVNHSPDSLVLRLADPDTGESIEEFARGYSLACAYVENRPDGDVFHAFAAEQPNSGEWFKDVVHLKSRDLKSWNVSLAVAAEQENLLNSSVCRCDDGYVMAYESNQPVKFCVKFAKSSDLDNWEKIPNLFFAGPDGKSYSACPVIRWHAPYYYVIYLRENKRGGYESAAIRSKDLREWEESPKNPILAASEGEGINNSDVDLFERDGKTWLYYAVGNQEDWAEIRRASFDGSEREFFESCFSE